MEQNLSSCSYDVFFFSRFCMVFYQIGKKKYIILFITRFFVRRYPDFGRLVSGRGFSLSVGQHKGIGASFTNPPSPQLRGPGTRLNDRLKGREKRGERRRKRAKRVQEKKKQEKVRNDNIILLEYVEYYSQADGSQACTGLSWG